MLDAVDAKLHNCHNIESEEGNVSQLDVTLTDVDVFSPQLISPPYSTDVLSVNSPGSIGE